MDYEDIYQHVTSPEVVFLGENTEGIVAMASYNSVVLSGIPSLIVEGIAVAPEEQGKGLFGRITDTARSGESSICLRTQNPRMYRALQRYCSAMYPSEEHIPEAIRAIRTALAKQLRCEIDEMGIVRGYYGGLFYGAEPTHGEVSGFFREFGVDMHKGDALLCVGIK